MLFHLSFAFLTLSAGVPFSSDPCQVVCDQYSAANRGEGENLCDPVESSQCIESVCTHLFWSVTDDAQPGFVYSLTGNDLIGNERSSPVSCEQAIQIVSTPSIIVRQEETLNYFNTALEVFVRLPVIQRRMDEAHASQRGPLEQLLASHVALTTSTSNTGTFPPSTQPILEYLEQRSLFRQGDTLPLRALRYLVGAMSMEIGDDMSRRFYISLEENRTCSHCNHTASFNSAIEGIRFEAVVGDMRTVHLQDLINDPAYTMNHCGACNSDQSLRTRRRITNAPEIMVVEYQRYREPTGEYMITNVQAPLSLNVSPLTQVSSNYTLIATIHRESLGGDYFANFFDQHSGQWMQYRHGVIFPIEVSATTLSSTATMFFYHRT